MCTYFYRNFLFQQMDARTNGDGVRISERPARLASGNRAQITISIMKMKTKLCRAVLIFLPNVTVAVKFVCFSRPDDPARDRPGAHHQPKNSRQVRFWANKVAFSNSTCDQLVATKIAFSVIYDGTTWLHWTLRIWKLSVTSSSHLETGNSFFPCDTAGCVACGQIGSKYNWTCFFLEKASCASP